MTKLTNEEIIAGVQSQNHVVLHSIYRSSFRIVSLYIQRNSGTEEDANDIFQEALIVVYRKVQEPSFSLTCSFETYLYAICRNLWLKELHNRDRIPQELIGDALFNEFELEDDIENVILMNDRYRLYQKHFELMGEDCKKLMTLFLKKVPLKDIARVMGLKSEQYAKKKKFRCKEALVKSIQSDVEFNHISDL
ncbi:sigma-70 family RNA polymerase sigma factor [Halosquirtibacter laminarini]|uniref:Sigma-70 family RNA polymerase sigma factor n=1 Tax=Halosquirtibacter laminarini TaxID=3374600 RepID=A0AC61NNK1_9BACT|nr:sigma-70 family RNA polymerase sigma factor [Prolixibacteraceae bacterium]